MGTVPSTVAGNPCPVLSLVPSTTPLYYADMRLTLREWLDALIGRDVLSERSVETEATRLLPSRPRASRRISTSSEALCAGPRANRRIGNLSEALRGRASGEGASARRRVGFSSEAFAARASGESENRSRPRGCPLALIFARSKQSFFQFSLRVPLFLVSDNTIHNILCKNKLNREPNAIALCEKSYPNILSVVCIWWCPPGIS